MKLLYQTHSPCARKALVFAHEAGLAGHVEVVHHETSPLRRNEAVFAANPLGKVPVLLRPGLPALVRSVQRARLHARDPAVGADSRLRVRKKILTGAVGAAPGVRL